MKALKIIMLGLATTALIGTAGYLYASSGMSNKPGYLPMSQLENLAPVQNIEPLISIKLGPGGVGPVRWLFKQIAFDGGQELEASERIVMSALKELQGVQLKVYEVGENRQIFDQAITQATANLKHQNWLPLLKVHEDDEHVVVMHSGTHEQITGLSIMASTPDKAVFVNLIGPFSADTIAATAGL